MDVLVLMQVSMSSCCLFHLTHLVLMMYVMFEPMRLFANWLATEQEPVIPGCFLRARAIGLMPMIDQA
jgi:hypothetical protein